MQIEIYDLSRGEFGRRVYGDCTDFSSIKEPINSLMKKVEGTELIRDKYGPLCPDEYHATYYISPEGVSIHFEAFIGVQIKAFGINEKAIDQAKQKIRDAFKPKYD